MEQEAKENALDAPEDDRITSSAPSTSGERSPAELSAESYLSRSLSSSRLNAGAPEFIPRVPTTAVVGGHSGGHQRLVKIHHHPTATPPMIPVLHPPEAAVASPQFVTPGPPIGVYDYYGGSVGGGAGGFAEHEFVQAPADSDPATSAMDGLSDDIVQKVTKQVEYYFSDANLATTEHLMRFISKDPEGFVPIAVIASFKKIKALVYNNMLLSNALRTSAKLVVSDDGKKVKRLHPFTEADVDELQTRIVVAENLPEDHCYQNLMKIFSAVGSVKTIRTCYPQTLNGTTNPTNRSSKLDMLFSNKGRKYFYHPLREEVLEDVINEKSMVYSRLFNVASKLVTKLHAFVEYETVEDAEKCLSDLSDERNWRSGLRLRLLNKCMAKQGAARGRKAGHEGDGTGEEEDVLATNQQNERQPEYPSQPPEASFELVGDDGLTEKENGGGRRGRGRGRGRGRARGQYINNNDNQRGGSGHGHGLAIGTPPSSHLMQSEQPAAPRQPPGPRMPDGTRGFIMGRGRPIITSRTVAGV